MSTQDAAPRIYIKTFGEITVFKDDEALSHHVLRRQKIQNLLAILAINRGKSVSCSYLQDVLWPDSEGIAQRNNLYSLWSLLRQALTDSGCSPDSFIRNNNHCKMNESLCDTDISEFERLCHAINYKNLSDIEIQESCNRLIELGSKGFYPSQEEIPSLTRFRSDLQHKMVDALLAASYVLHDHNLSSKALNFCYEAKRIDENREDVYEQLFILQIGLGRRTQAIQTYFEYRHLLQDNFGLDLPASMKSSYLKLIE